MTIKDAEKLANLARENGIDALEVIVALHIASDYCTIEEVQTKYGTIACNGLRELREELINRQ